MLYLDLISLRIKLRLPLRSRIMVNALRLKFQLKLYESIILVRAAISASVFSTANCTRLR